MMEFGIIGNCQYNALINPHGNVEWLCWPRFDSSFVFGSMLSRERGGEFYIRPAKRNYKSHQYYVRNTNVLVTRFEAEDGIFEVVDFAPRFFQHDRHFRPSQLVRIVQPIEGQPLALVKCNPVYQYGKKEFSASLGSNHIRYSSGKDKLRLHTDVSLSKITESRSFQLSGRKHFILTWGKSLDAGLAETCEEFLAKTIRYWQRWVKHCHLPEFAQQAVIRSALTLKIHQFEDTGAIIAASTLGIPEFPNTPRTWDYRYCWIRDAYYTVSALLQLSHFEELESFERFLTEVLNSGNGNLQPVYGISGETNIDEWIADHLEGYQGMGPVRIGNAAYKQVQHDAYGQFIAAVFPLLCDERFNDRDFEVLTRQIKKLLTKIEEVIDLPDAGIWEFRGLSHVHAYTIFMHYFGAQRAFLIAKKHKDSELQNAAQRVLQKASKLIASLWNSETGCFNVSMGLDAVDATSLVPINLGLIDPKDPKCMSIIDAVQKRLGLRKGLIRRYARLDDFGDTEGSFILCDFWLVEALARSGRLDEAERLFCTILESATPLGHLSEDINPDDGRLWGNFPQTYSHVGLIHAAFEIDKQILSRGPSHAHAWIMNF